MYDFLLCKAVDKALIEGTLGQLFGVDSSQIAIVASIEDVETSYPLLAEIVGTEGDFQIRLSVYLSQTVQGPTEIHVAHGLSQALHTDVLISDQSINPFTWILIDQSGHTRSVSLDAASLDHNEYRLAR